MRSVILMACLAVFTAPVVGAPAKQAEPVVPNATEVAVYVPPGMLKLGAYLPGGTLWIEPGRALADAVSDVGRAHFPKLVLVPGASPGLRYGLLLDLAPKWTPTPGRVSLTIPYVVYDGAGKKLHEGSVTQEAPLRGGNFNAAATLAARDAVQKVMAGMRRAVNPDPASHPATADAASIDYSTLVDREKPVRTGTAFFVNRAGQLLTAEHVARDCSLLEAHQDGATFPVRMTASSSLLDVAVLASGRARESGLPLRRGHELILGEAITSVGYPLQGLLGDSPNLTRGNVSASKGIRGSYGMFQFSAPIQPGNSGGPLVSDQGELLGMAVGTLNAAALAERGSIPQNVNFALDARHLARFLQKENVAFDTVQPREDGGLQVANKAALGNTVQLNCYQ